MIVTGKVAVDASALMPLHSDPKHAINFPLRIKFIVVGNNRFTSPGLTLTLVTKSKTIIINTTRGEHSSDATTPHFVAWFLQNGKTAPNMSFSKIHSRWQNDAF
jgi:hypothetical protein